MRMYYLTRQYPGKELEYYSGGGCWSPMQLQTWPGNERCSIRFYKEYDIARAIEKSNLHSTVMYTDIYTGE